MHLLLCTSAKYANFIAAQMQLVQLCAESSGDGVCHCCVCRGVFASCTARCLRLLDRLDWRLQQDAFGPHAYGLLLGQTCSWVILVCSSCLRAKIDCVSKLSGELLDRARRRKRSILPGCFSLLMLFARQHGCIDSMQEGADENVKAAHSD